MGVYTRFKKSPDGFRALVELLETTPVSRRQKMIDVGLEEDLPYTLEAMQYMLSFEDVLTLSDMELADVIAQSPPRLLGVALSRLGEKVSQRFLQLSRPPVTAELEVYLGSEASLAEIGGAQLKIVSVVRKLEKQGLIQTKRIPGR